MFSKHDWCLDCSQPVLPTSYVYEMWNYESFPFEGYVSQATRLGALGLPAYRMFSLEELEEATDSFDTSTFLDQGSHGQVCTKPFPNAFQQGDCHVDLLVLNPANTFHVAAVEVHFQAQMSIFSD